MSFTDWVVLVNGKINDIVWGPPMLVLLVGTGIFLTLATGFFQVTHMGKVWRSTLGSLFSGKNARKEGDKNITPFQAVTTALAATVGTGNVAGVATAIVSGGPGAVFWMWFSAFFGMITKYAEVVLALQYREKDKNGLHYGGPMYYIEKGLRAKWLAVLFALFAVIASFGIGNMLQANSIASSMEATFQVNPMITGIAIMLITAMVIVGGISSIAKVTEKLIPFMAVFYVVGAVVAIVWNLPAIPSTFSLIFKEAFSMRAVGGGIMGYVVTQAMRYGFARGVFSNEAGLGSAPIAHAASSSNNPVKQGMWGIFEVFVDTIVMCSLTALVILTSGLLPGVELSGAPLTSAAFSQHFGSLGGVFVTLSIIFFALSTILGWSYYGERCVAYLFGENNRIASFIYKAVFLFMIIIGSVGGLELLWDIADTLNGMMAIPNLIALLALSPVVLRLTKRFLENPKSVELHD